MKTLTDVVRTDSVEARRAAKSAPLHITDEHMSSANDNNTT